MQLPLRLQLKASRCYLLFLASGHILAGVAVCLLPLPGLARAACLLLLALLLLRLVHATTRSLPSLLLRRDGKIEVQAASGDVVLAEVGNNTVVWPMLVVLHLKPQAGVQKPLVLLADSVVGAESHRQLRVWLRWRTEQKG